MQKQTLKPRNSKKRRTFHHTKGLESYSQLKIITLIKDAVDVFDHMVACCSTEKENEEMANWLIVYIYLEKVQTYDVIAKNVTSYN